MFMKGFARFFQGDMVGAVSILVPQLENSIRYILRSNGHDVVKVNNDMTQEDLDLSALLRMRGPMEQVFGPSLTLDIENVFSYRGGPSVRHSVAHGRFSWNEFHGADAIYGCWLILHMACLPLLAEWESLVELHVKSIWST